MAVSDWAGAPYVRIYSTLSADHPKVWSDLRLLGAYVRLLSVADPVWPGLAEVPRGIPSDVLADLAADEVVDVEGDLFQFHGLATERNGRHGGRSLGGMRRAADAERDERGRFVPAAESSNVQHDEGGDAGRTSSMGPLLDVAGDAGEMLDADAGPSSIPARPPASPPARPTRAGGLGVDVSRAQGRARPDRPDPSRIACRDYNAHRADHHWWGDGIGWKCSTCERENDSTGRSFREKVMAAGGDDDAPF